jgi:hypothetical protein
MKTNTLTTKLAALAWLSCTELLACPFCGAPAYIEDDSFIFGWQKTYCARCLRCHARQGWRETPEQAAMIWNLRHANAGSSDRANTK